MNATKKLAITQCLAVDLVSCLFVCHVAVFFLLFLLIHAFIKTVAASVLSNVSVLCIIAFSFFFGIANTCMLRVRRTKVDNVISGLLSKR